MGGRRTIDLGFAVAAALALFYLAYALYRYATFGSYFDHAEVDVALLSWRWVSEGLLYDSPDSLDHILTAYGPLLYLTNAAFLALFGGSITVSKLAALTACWLAAGAFIGHAERRYGLGLAGVGGLMFIAYPLIVTPIGFWTRPDSLLVLLVTLGVLFAAQGERGRPWMAAVGVAVCAGLAVNLKVHAALYFVPLVLRFCLFRPLLTWPVMAAVALGCAMLPFALPGVSLENYIAGIKNIVGARGIDADLLRTSARFSLMFLLPGLLFLLPLLGRKPLPERADFMYFLLLALCVGIGLYPSSVPGASWYHLLPFFPISVDLSLRLLRHLDSQGWWGPVAKILMALILIIMAYLPQKRFLRTLDTYAWTAEVAEETRAIMARFPQAQFQVGYDSDNVGGYGRTFIVRPLLAFAGYRPYALSAAASMERQYAHVPFPPLKQKYLSQCGPEVWIFPKSNGDPFTMNGFFPGTHAFPDDLSPAFLATHQRIERGTHLDLWGCRK
ncbi:hypothetical protein JCM17960_11490 [Magnetospira thiophila]